MPLAASFVRAASLGRLGLAIARARRRPAGPGRDAAHRLAAARMGELRGLPHKIGQMLSVGDLDDDDSPFASLTERAEPAPPAHSFAWIARELQAPVASVFRHLEPRAAAASVGQVHRGVLHDGRPVAVKVQYPGVAAALESDLAALGWLATPLAASRPSFDLSAYRDEMRRSLLREFDYVHEAATLRRFAGRAIQIEGLTVPEPIDRWCSSRLLTMSWVEGEAVAATRGWPDATRRNAGRILLQSFLRGCFVWRELHADPHAGNVRFARDGARARVGLVDFGCVTTLSAAESGALRRLAEHGPDLGLDELVAAYVALGFDPARLAPMAAQLPAVSAILFEPFHQHGPYDVRTWQLSDRLAAALGEYRWAFRLAGPASLLFAIRAFQGVVRYLSVLDARLAWREELLALPGGASATAVPVPAGSGTAYLPQEATTNMPASALRIHVTRDGRTTVQLTFAVEAVAHLADLVPIDLRDRLRTRHIDLSAIAASAVAGGYAPGDLFEETDGELTVRVWIE